MKLEELTLSIVNEPGWMGMLAWEGKGWPTME
jgi:hypothetical protein